MPKQQKIIVELNIIGIFSDERTEIANRFNRFFILLQHTLRDQSTSLCIKEVDQSETAEVFQQLQHSKAKDNFGLDTAFTTKNNTVLSSSMPDTHVVNLSIRASEFPQQWKTAVIIPASDRRIIDQFYLHSQRLLKNSCQTTC